MEQKITSLLQARNIKAVNLLYDNYSAILYGTILRIVHSPDLAQEALQDSFLKAWKFGYSYDVSKGKLVTWLLNIAKNTAIDMTRSADWKMRERTGDLSAAFSFTKTSTNPEHMDLRKLVDTLHPKHRVLIDMIYFQGYTQEEIRQELNIPLGTIKTRVRAALVDLRTIFGDINGIVNKQQSFVAIG